MLKVKELIVKVLGMLNNPVSTKGFTNSATFSNSDYVTGSINVTRSGHWALGIVGVIPAANTVTHVVTRYYIDNGTLYYTLRHLSGAKTSTETTTFVVLYLKLPTWGGYFISSLLSTIEGWWRYVRREEVAYENACRLIKYIPWSNKHIYKLWNCIKYYSNEKRLACGGGNIKLQHGGSSCYKDSNRQQHHRRGSWNYWHWQFAFLRCASKSRDYIHDKQISLQRKFGNTLLLAAERGCVAC